MASKAKIIWQCSEALIGIGSLTSYYYGQASYATYLFIGMCSLFCLQGIVGLTRNALKGAEAKSGYAYRH